MKYLCLVYGEEQKIATVNDRHCLDFDESLRASGQCVASEALQPVSTATTVRVRDGRMTLTDGPFAETKEQLAGFYLIEARDLNEAIQLAAKIPPAQVGSIEVRPIRPIREVNATRELVVTTPSPREILLTRRFDARRELLFDAFTKPELVRRWMGTDAFPMVECDIDLRVGGSCRYVWGGKVGAVGLNAVFKEIVRPARIVHTELFDEDWTGGETLVTTTFEESSGATALGMRILYSSEEARDAVLQSPMEKGLAENLNKLAAMLDNT